MIPFYMYDYGRCIDVRVPGHHDRIKAFSLGQSKEARLFLACLTSGAMVNELFFGPEMTSTDDGMIDVSGAWRVR